MPVGMYGDLDLEYPRQVGLVDEIKVEGVKVLICKNFKNESITRVENCGIKKNKLIDYIERNKKLLV